MRFPASALMGLCLCALVTSGAPSNATTARSARTIVIPAGVPGGKVRPYPIPVRPGQMRPISRRGRRFSVPTCTSAGPGSFVGGGGPNVAGGTDSGVLEGSFNDACDNRSAIGAGNGNGIGGGGGFYEFIGAGIGNAASGQDGFVGAGESNNNSGIDAALVGGNTNTVSNYRAFIGAGESNTNSGLDSAIVGGSFNTVSASYSGIGAGPGNTVSAPSSFIAAGYQNNINGATYPAAADNSFIGAGAQNTIKALAANGGLYGVIGGGFQNLLEGAYGAIGGGYANTVTASNGTVGGGFANHANGGYATVPGGDGNTATGAVSFAAGHSSYAAHSGAFVWSDDASGATQLKSTASNQFLARASGGVKFFSNPTLTTGVVLAPGSGTWGSVSDRAVKTNVAAIDDAGILDKVAALPISKWSYISEQGVRHVGPMAQDFYAAFGVGADNKHITSIDEDGVALAAIKALHRENSVAFAAINSLHRENGQLKAQLACKDAAVSALQRQMHQLSAAVASMLSR